MKEININIEREQNVLNSIEASVLNEWDDTVAPLVARAEAHWEHCIESRQTQCFLDALEVKAPKHPTDTWFYLD